MTRDPEQPARQRRKAQETRPDRIAALIRDLHADIDHHQDTEEPR